MSEAKERIQKTSKTMLIIIKIATILCIVGLVCCVGATVAVQIYKDELVTIAEEAVTAGNVDMNFTISSLLYDSVGNLASGGAIISSIFQMIFASIVSIVLVIVILQLLRKIFKVFGESYSPFLPEIMGKLRAVFIIIFVISLRNSLLIGAVIGLALYCVYQMYAYGCELQKQSDETL